MSNQSRRGSERRSRLRGGLLIGGLAVIASACSGSGPQSALEPKSRIAEDIDDLWDLVFVLATGVFIFVMALLVWAIVRYRDRGDDREPKQIHGNSFVEVGGIVFSVVLLTIISVPTVQGLFDVRAIPEGPDVLQIKVTGHQWWWEFEYPGFTSPDGRPLVTANELHIPADTKVNLTMTSADVIHSFWVPSLNGKRDVVPGRTTNLTLEADSAALADSAEHDPSVYLDEEDIPEGLIAIIPGQCAEFCGLSHADMRIRVFVHDKAGFAEWAAGQLEPSPIPAETVTPTNDADDGYSVFQALCATCHQATVVNTAGEVEVVGTPLAPNLTHFGSRSTFAGSILVNNAENLRAWLDNPSDLKPMDPDRNDIAAGRILGMPDLGLTVDEIDGLIDLLDSWK